MRLWKYLVLVLVLIAIIPFVFAADCGDGICESWDTENQNTCSEDCADIVHTFMQGEKCGNHFDCFDGITTSIDHCLPGYVAYYEFEGNTLDSAGNNDGTNHGASYVAGQVGEALDFDGDDYVTVPDSSDLDITNELSISLWVKGNESSNLNTRYALGKANAYALQVGRTPPDGPEIVFKIRNSANTAWNSLYTGADVLDDEWHHVVATYDGNKSRVYVDGSLVATSSELSDTIYASSSNLMIGSYSSGSYHFNGSIDDVKIFDYALDPLNLGHEGLCRNRRIVTPVGSCTLDYVTFYEFEDNDANDSMGKNNGTISGAGFVDGKCGDALNLDGLDDYVTVSDSDDLDITEEISISFLIKGNESSNLNVRYAVAKANAYAVQVVRTPAYGPEIVFRIRKSDNSAWNTLNTGEHVLDDEWHHVVATYDGNKSRVYVDGSLVATSSELSDTIYASSSNLMIGSYSSGSYHFNGSIDDVKILDYALDPISLDYEISCMNEKIIGSTAGRCMPSYVSHYDFENNDTDDSTGRNNGTVSGTSFVNGKCKEALYFDGDDYLTVSDSDDLDITNKLTLSAWVKGDAADNSGVRYALGKSLAYGLQISRTTGPEIIFRIRNSANTAWHNLYAKTDVLDGTWHHIVAKYGGDKMRVYVDDILINTSSSIGDTIYASSSDLVIGAYSSAFGNFNGSIDDVKIYDYGLNIADFELNCRNDIDSGKNLGMFTGTLTSIGGIEEVAQAIAVYDTFILAGVVDSVSGTNWTNGDWNSSTTKHINISLYLRRIKELNPDIELFGYVPATADNPTKARFVELYAEDASNLDLCKNFTGFDSEGNPLVDSLNSTDDYNPDSYAYLSDVNPYVCDCPGDVCNDSIKIIDAWANVNDLDGNPVIDGIYFAYPYPKYITTAHRNAIFNYTKNEKGLKIMADINHGSTINIDFVINDSQYFDTTSDYILESGYYVINGQYDTANATLIGNYSQYNSLTWGAMATENSSVTDLPVGNQRAASAYDSAMSYLASLFSWVREEEDSLDTIFYSPNVWGGPYIECLVDSDCDAPRDRNNYVKTVITYHKYYDSVDEAAEELSKQDILVLTHLKQFNRDVWDSYGLEGDCRDGRYPDMVQMISKLRTLNPNIKLFGVVPSNADTPPNPNNGTTCPSDNPPGYETCPGGQTCAEWAEANNEPSWVCYCGNWGIGTSWTCLGNGTCPNFQFWVDSWLEIENRSENVYIDGIFIDKVSPGYITESVRDSIIGYVHSKDLNILTNNAGGAGPGMEFIMDSNIGAGDYIQIEDFYLALGNDNSEHTLDMIDAFLSYPKHSVIGVNVLVPERIRNSTEYNKSSEYFIEVDCNSTNVRNAYNWFNTKLNGRGTGFFYQHAEQKTIPYCDHCMFKYVQDNCNFNTFPKCRNFKCEYAD